MTSHERINPVRDNRCWLVIYCGFQALREFERDSSSNRAAYPQQEYSRVPGRPRASFLETWVAKKLDKLQETVAQCDKAYIKAYKYTAIFLSFLCRNTQQFGTKRLSKLC